MVSTFIFSCIMWGKLSSAPDRCSYWKMLTFPHFETFSRMAAPLKAYYGAIFFLLYFFCARNVLGKQWMHRNAMFWLTTAVLAHISKLEGSRTQKLKVQSCWKHSIREIESSREFFRFLTGFVRYKVESSKF